MRKKKSLKRKNIKPLTKCIYKKLYLTHENENKLLIGTGMYLTSIHSLIHKYVWNAFYIPEATISTEVYSLLGKKEQVKRWVEYRHVL